MIEWFDMDDARWERYFQRIQYMELGFVRCMLAAYWYCTGLMIIIIYLCLGLFERRW